MKTLNVYIGLLFLLICSACTDYADSLVNVNDDLVNLNLKFELQGGKEIVVGRAAATDQEKKLYDLHFYVFDAQGHLTGYEKLLSDDENGGTQNIPSAGTVSIRTKSGASYIYAIANINKSTTYYLNPDDLALLNIETGSTDAAYWRNIEASQLTRERLLSIRFNRDYGNENKLVSPDPAGNVFVMSGYVNDGNAVTLSKGASETHVVKLYRILSKITLEIKPKTGLSGTFTPKYYRLCNVPESGILIPKAGISTASTYLAGNTTTANVESSYRWNFDGNNEITFYYPENLQVAKPNSQISVWKDREKNAWTNNTKTFTHAADGASYIEIYGDYVDKAASITASVVYTIHFGDFRTNGGNIADFNLIRNYAYDYEVTFNGVTDIEVEAKTSNGTDSDRPHAEGMIVNAQAGKHFEVDAHYEARLLTFNKSLIQAAGFNGFVLSVKTPFGETREVVSVREDGVYSIGGEKLCELDNVNSIFNQQGDYQWVKFVKNYYYTSGNWWNPTITTNLVDGSDVSRSVCKYPGDSNCLNVFQLLSLLNNDDAYTEKGGTEVYYTCFIDENYYANKSWPEYVNKDPRTMLLANDLQVSPDGKSLYANVVYSISQRSISTFYTTDYYPNNNNLVKAFGTEIFDEEKIHNVRLANSTIGTISNPQDWNARSSALSTNQNQGWYNNMRIVEGIQPQYTTAARACMSRNRDLDGDGTIDGDEVRWYLAGVDQYRALFFGQNALNPDAYLISNAELAQINTDYGGDWGDDSNGHSYRSKYHYFTCSGGNKTTFWPEEGLTNNPMASIDPDYWVSEAQLVRCVRTLVSNGTGLEDPEKYYSYDGNTQTFNLGGIKATRNYTEDPLEMHNEIEGSNNLYSSFVVAKSDLAENWNDYEFYLRDITGNHADPCSNYKNQTGDNGEKQYSWRTPNQKEIALMVSASVFTNGGNYGTRTRFSGSDNSRDERYWNWHNTPGFWTNTQQINVGGQGETAPNDVVVKIRCVRDNK